MSDRSAPAVQMGRSPLRLTRPIKWTLMLTAVAWVLVYRLSEEAARLPEFVYVNF